MNKSLVFVLGAIIMINIIAILILQARLEVGENENQDTEMQNSQIKEKNSEIPPERQIVRGNPEVRTLILENSQECPKCFDIDRYIEKLDPLLNMSIARASPYEFDLGYYPAILFNGTIEEYSELVEGWGQEQIIEVSEGKHKGKWYVLPTLNPPYFDVPANKTRGLVTVTYLSYDSCDECYDVMDNKLLLEEQNLNPDKELVFDAESVQGAALVRKYNITKLPTMILNEEAAYYPQITLGWHVVGTVEYDGSYVLRELNRLKLVYYDTQLDRVMIP